MKQCSNTMGTGNPQSMSKCDDQSLLKQSMASKIQTPSVGDNLLLVCPSVMSDQSCSYIPCSLAPSRLPIPMPLLLAIVPNNRPTKSKCHLFACLLACLLTCSLVCSCCCLLPHRPLHVCPRHHHHLQRAFIQQLCRQTKVNTKSRKLAIEMMTHF